MKKLEVGVACWATLTTLITALQGHGQEYTYEWPATREDLGSIIVVLEPEPGVEDHTMAIMLSGQVGLIDSTPWHQTSQPFVKQYLVEPGSYVVHGSADVEATKVQAEPGKAALVQLLVENPLDKEQNYQVTVSSAENVNLGQAQSYVFETLSAHKGAPQIHLTSLRTDGDDLEFALEPLAEYIPGLPWPIPPAPNPPPPPSPTPQDGPQ